MIGTDATDGPRQGRGSSVAFFTPALRASISESSMDLSTFFLWLAVIAFGLAAFKVTSPVVDWTPLGYALVVIGFLV